MASNPHALLILVVIFGVALVIQLIYFICFLAAIGKKAQPKTSAFPPVSVIVCAHDEEDNLRSLVPALLSQNYPDFEIIIVNDRSNDNTYDYLLDFSTRNPKVKMVNVQSVPDHVNSKKYAITLGIRAASHEWILLTDADCRPASDQWISKMSEQFEEKTKFVLGFSPYQEQPGFLNHFVRFESLITALQYLSFGLLKRPYMGVGRNLAYRKSLFLEKKGFNNFLNVMGGDDDLFVNQHARGGNTLVMVHPDTNIMSIPETTWTGFFYQKIRHLSVGKRYKGFDKFLLGTFKLTWVVTVFLGILLAVIYTYFYAIIAALLIRLTFMMLSLRALLKKSGLKFSYWIMPVLDFVYPIYYISTGLVALFTKKVRWKN